MDIGVGLSTEKDSFLAAKEAVQQALGELKQDTIDLVLIFSSMEYANIKTIKALSNLLGPVAIAGCTGLGLICNQAVLRRGISVVLLHFPDDVYCNTAFVKDVSSDNALVAGEELGEKLLYGFKQMRRDIAMVFSDGHLEDGSSLTQGIREQLGRSFPFLGISASESRRGAKTFLYYNQEVATNAVSGILFAGKSSFGVGIKHGWKPLGKPRRITRAEGNIIYEIEHTEAAKLYEDYLDCDLAKLKSQLKSIAALYPIGVYVEGEPEYLLRNVMEIRDDGAFVCQGNIPADAPMRLMIGTKESCINATKEALYEAKRELWGRKIDCVFVFESAVRYSLLGADTEKEIGRAHV